jgi:hypothetical protein
MELMQPGAQVVVDTRICPEGDDRSLKHRDRKSAPRTAACPEPRFWGRSSRLEAELRADCYEPERAGEFL